jgi:hypothetical protein
MWEILAPLAVIAGLLGLFGAVLRHAFSRSKQRVARWARENGFELRRCEWRWSGDSPFAPGGREVLWTVRIVDREGRTRNGWVRCGSPLIGMLSSRVDVRWMPEGNSAFR